MSPIIARWRYEREIKRNGIDHPSTLAKLGRLIFHAGDPVPAIVSVIERVAWLRSAIPGFNNRHRRARP